MLVGVLLGQAITLVGLTVGTTFATKWSTVSLTIELTIQMLAFTVLYGIQASSSPGSCTWCSKGWWSSTDVRMGNRCDWLLGFDAAVPGLVEKAETVLLGPLADVVRLGSDWALNDR